MLQRPGNSISSEPLGGKVPAAQRGLFLRVLTWLELPSNI
jgi:hypothetical protein